MASIKAVLEEIGTPLKASIPNLQVLTGPKKQVTAPAAQIEPVSVDFGEAMARGHERWDITVRILVSASSEDAAAEQLYEFLGQVNDVKDIIENHIPLQDGTTAHGVFVRGARQFGLYEVSAIGYRGVEFNLDVYA